MSSMKKIAEATAKTRNGEIILFFLWENSFGDFLWLEPGENQTDLNSCDITDSELRLPKVLSRLFERYEVVALKIFEERKFGKKGRKKEISIKEISSYRLKINNRYGQKFRTFMKARDALQEVSFSAPLELRAELMRSAGQYFKAAQKAAKKIEI